jgi:hypothetical protein
MLNEAKASEEMRTGKPAKPSALSKEKPKKAA